MKKILLLVTLLLIVGLMIGSYYLLGNYSEGTRAGVIQKLSRKGVVFKTWEGQLNLGGFNTEETSGGVAPTIWSFSVRSKNQDVLKELEEAAASGKRVKLHYDEKFVKFFWVGETKYFVNKVDYYDRE